jgi:hypothetical protein
LKSLFFAHASQKELMRSFPDILGMDCTYKTNRYNMPLLHFVGVTSIGRYFSAGFCFLSGEKEDDYDWAIEQFHEAFIDIDPPQVHITDNEAALKLALKTRFPDIPQLLCMWHINKNVLTHAQRAWITTDPWLSDEEKEEVQKHRDDFMTVWNQV